jgi:hypothetical protein
MTPVMPSFTNVNDNDDTVRYQTYQILKLSYTKPIRYWTYQIPNLSDTKPVRYQTYQIPNLSDTKPIRYRTYQIANLSDTEPVRYQTYQISNLVSLLIPPSPHCGEICAENGPSKPFSPSQLTITANPSQRATPASSPPPNSQWPPTHPSQRILWQNWGWKVHHSPFSP